MIKVSVIVPVYNTSKYLPKCLDSLVNQTLKDIEIIVVDDGSSDDSVNIICDYQKKYDNIKAFFIEHLGRSGARNVGIDKASGKYIGFVDSDDYVDLNMFELLYKKANNNYDIVLCDLYEENEKKISYMSGGLQFDLNSKNEVKENMVYLNTTLCNKIYKANIVKNNKFNNDMFFEDVDFLYRMFLKVGKIGVVDKQLYHYYSRINSATNNTDNWVKLFDSLDYVLKYYKDKKEDKKYFYELEYFYVKHVLGSIINNYSKNRDFKEYIIFVRKTIKKINKKFKDYRNNKYFKRLSLVRRIYFKYFNLIFAILIYLKNRFWKH